MGEDTGKEENQGRYWELKAFVSSGAPVAKKPESHSIEGDQGEQVTYRN